MANITYNIKTQTEIYDSKKFNADDANEIKTVVNGLNATKADISQIIDGNQSLGAWNASANTPTLTATPASVGKYYTVNVAGTQSITGAAVNYISGDKILSNGTVWQHVPFVVNLDAYSKSVDVNEQFNSLFTSTNMVDTSVFINAYYPNQTSELTPSSDWCISDYILVKPNTEYAIGNWNPTTKRLVAATYHIYNFDANKAKESPFITSAMSRTTTATQKYVRLLFKPTNAAVFMMVEGNGLNLTTYVPYKKVLSTSIIPAAAPIPDGSIGANKLDFTELIQSANIYNSATAISGWYGNDGIAYQTNANFYTSDYIAVKPNTRYYRGRVEGLNDNSFVYTYNATKVPVAQSSTNTKVYAQSTAGDPYFTTPDNCYFVRSIMANLTQSKQYMIIEAPVSFVAPSSFIQYVNIYKIKADNLPTVTNSDSLQHLQEYGISDLGSLDFQGFTTDYSHFIIAGQSLSMGWQSYQAYSTTAVANNFMIGSSIFPTVGNDNTNVFKPLVNKMADTNAGECPLVAALNSFRTIFDRYNSKGSSVKFVGTASGEGGKSVTQLAKGTTLYTTRFLNALTRAKTAATAEAKTISCPVIIWMQGEQDYVDATTKAAYKTLLLQQKNDMQADVIATYGQTFKPLFFLYQTSGVYITNAEMTITQGQLEFAQENEDVILMNPHYALPEYNGGHLTPNGYMWYGELIAKTLSDVFIKGKRFLPVTPSNIVITEKTVTIDVTLPVAPLVIDTYTTDAQTYNGFKVTKNGTELYVAVKVVGNQVVLTANEVLTGNIVISYGGQGRNGAGNIRDSDTWRSKATYRDDSTGLTLPVRYNPKDKNGNSLVGKGYPCYNWLSQFYYTFSI